MTAQRTRSARGRGSRRSAGRMIAVSGLVAGAFFMEMLDGTVIATALPQMARSFGVSAVSISISA